MITFLVMGLSSVRGDIVFTTLFSFTGTGGSYPGGAPFCGLTPGSDGNLYGTTTSGGSNNLGTLFKVTTGGAFTSLLSFNGTNGSAPYAALALGKDNNFYGTTFRGGPSNWGTVFEYTAGGTFTNLFSFTGTNNAYQGANPASPLVPAADGSFYGTANFGGLTNAAYQGSGYGSVFQLTASGSLVAPALFANTNGAHPSGGMILGQDGNFYGTTTWGGLGINGTTFPGYGTVFKMTPDGTFTNIYKFTGGADGGFIYAGLVQGRDGYLYGSAFSGGAEGYGTVFKVSTNGSFVLLHSFISYDSGSPYGGMTQGSDGNFYGTTYGAYVPYGSIFRVTPDGAFTNLFFFHGTDGDHPDGVLVQGPDGNFYGTTSTGGGSGLGTVFQLSVPLAPEITALTQTNGTVTVTWSSVAGQSYQLQYIDDLKQPAWSFVTKSTTASGGTMNAIDSDYPAASGQRFYRVALQ